MSPPAAIASMNALVPDFAMVPRLLISSFLVMPMPESSMVKVEFVLSGMILMKKLGWACKAQLFLQVPSYLIHNSVLHGLTHRLAASSGQNLNRGESEVMLWRTGQGCSSGVSSFCLKICLSRVLALCAINAAPEGKRLGFVLFSAREIWASAAMMGCCHESFKDFGGAVGA